MSAASYSMFPHTHLHLWVIRRHTDGAEIRLRQDILDDLATLAWHGEWPNENRAMYDAPGALIGGGDGYLSFWSLSRLVDAVANLVDGEDWWVRMNLSVEDQALVERIRKELAEYRKAALGERA